MELIIDRLPIGEGLLSILHHSRVWDGVVKIRCTLDELSELAGNVDPNNTTDMQLHQNFAAVADAIAKVEQRYWVRPRLVSVVGKG